MRIAWSWLSEWVDLSFWGDDSKQASQKLAEALIRRGLEVEAVLNCDEGLEKVVTAEILECQPHPQADRLKLCQVSWGTEQAVLQIVCGATNMKVGDKVALAQVGALLPNGVFIQDSTLRGQKSQGMLCSEAELKLQEHSEGIWILPSETPRGLPIAQLLGRQEILLDIKVTPNRADCLSHRGIAREVASLSHQGLRYPPCQLLSLQASDFKFDVAINPQVEPLVPQFLGYYIQGVQVGPSPEAWVKRLESLGIRSVNNVVDATQLLMFALGHPVHAYDAGKIIGSRLEVRWARPGEGFQFLDGQSVQLSANDLVIADQSQPLALAGVMGATTAAVTQQTKDVFLECAEFHPKIVRAMSIAYQKRTDAAYRFERGIDPDALLEVLSWGVQWIQQAAGGERRGGIKKVNASSKARSWSILCDVQEVQKTCGFEVQDDRCTGNRIQRILESLGCGVHVKDPDRLFEVTPPSYRFDLRLPEDLQEEIARCLGYDHIPVTLPMVKRAVVPEKKIQGVLQETANKIQSCRQTRAVCTGYGLQEVINLAFTRRNWLEKCGFSEAIALKNPLSEEYECLVPALIPGLLRNAEYNAHHHFGSEPLMLRFFELRPVFTADLSKSSRDLSFETGIQEQLHLAFLMSGPRFAEGLKVDRSEVDLYDLKGFLEALTLQLGLRGSRWVAWDRLPSNIQRVSFLQDSAWSSLFHPGKSVAWILGHQVVGIWGELHPQKAQYLRVRSPLWLGEVDWDACLPFLRGAHRYQAWSDFPGMTRDFALLIPPSVSAEQVCQIALKVGRPWVKSAKVFDLYRDPKLPEGMTSLAVRVIFADEKRSLQESEAEATSAKILETWKKNLGAQRRGD